MVSVSLPLRPIGIIIPPAMVIGIVMVLFMIPPIQIPYQGLCLSLLKLFQFYSSEE